MGAAEPRICPRNYVRSDGIEWILNQYTLVDVPRVPLYFPAPYPNFTLIVNGAYEFNCTQGRSTSGPYYETINAGIEVYPFHREGYDVFPFHRDDELGWGNVYEQVGFNRVVVYSDPQKAGGHQPSKTRNMAPNETRIVKIVGLGGGRDSDGTRREGSAFILVPCKAPCVEPCSVFGGTWCICSPIRTAGTDEATFRGPWRRPRMRLPQVSE